MSDAGVGQNGFDLAGEELSVAALLRAAADGEVTAEQERRLELLIESDPELGRRFEAERELRSAVGRAFSDGPAAPAGLRERVASAMASADLTDAAMTDDAEALPTRMAPMTRDRSFWAGPAARVLAAAAALTLVATVFVVTRGTGTDLEIGSRTRAVQFVATEHSRCVTDIAQGAGKFELTNVSEMPGVTGAVLGREISLADLLASDVQNVNFVDAGRCHVPGGGSSMHLRFEAPVGEIDQATGEAYVERFSLFVQQDQGRLGLEEGVSYELDPSGGEVDLKSPSIFVWSRGGLVYYLVVDTPKACPKLRQKLEVPENSRPLTNAA